MAGTRSVAVSRSITRGCDSSRSPSPVGASLLAKNLRTPHGVRCAASSLTTLATVRRFDRLAPTGFAC
ncbi:hypothetical protein C1890_12645 [Pseudomonas sp. DP16D-R1]|nr:hypothetical protein C1890_12645 [Pseudomonas sp. DP16D-R1]